MKKSNWSKKIKTAVFISGTGSNLKFNKIFIIKKSPIKINLIISNNKKAKGLKFSKKIKIESKIYNFKKKMFQLKKIYLKILKKKKDKLICLAGFMKILSKILLKNLMEKF